MGVRASLLGVLMRSCSGDRRCFLRAESAMDVVVVGEGGFLMRSGLVDRHSVTRRSDALSPASARAKPH